VSATVSVQSLPYEDRADFVIPESSINRWLAIEADTSLALSLTRDDLDRFFFMHMQIGAALNHFQQAVTELSNGEVEKPRGQWLSRKGSILYN
jgi:hypothetical protein